MMETEKGKRIEQILATDVTREQLAEALWCAESSQRMWHGCAEENRSFRLKAEAENAKLRKWCIDLLGMAENGDPEWLHWPEVHDALRKLGVDV